jgi:nucleotide-binding universal stress UspA family protein
MYDAILVPTDGSDGSTAAADHALELARRYDATLHVLYVLDTRMSPVSTGMEESEIEAMVADSDERPTRALLEMAAAADVPATEAIRPGVPHEVIRDYVTETGIDLIVMGTHGRTGLEHALLGSVTERVLRTVDVPVLTTPIDS